MMGADPKSVMLWERGYRPPGVHIYPAIITFLGYEPWAEPGVSRKLSWLSGGGGV
jgi:hypothetical protein